MSRLALQICRGPTCRSLGADDILKAVRRKRLQDRVAVSEYHCFGRCEAPEGLCPCVKLGDRWIFNATESMIIQAVADLPDTRTNAGETEIDPFAKYFAD